jgi:hypothetical protein
MASSLERLLAQFKKLQQGSPHDAGLSSAMQSAQFQLSDLDRSYTKGRGEVQSTYDNLVRELGKQRETGVQNTMGRFADSGLLHSGIHATEQGKVEEGYQGGLTDAAQRRLSGFNQLDESRRQGESGIQQMLTGAQQDYARRQQEAAQSRAELQAQREAQAEQSRQAAAQHAQMMAAVNSGGGGGGGGGGGVRGMPQDPQKAAWARLAQQAQDWDKGWWDAVAAYGTQGGLQYIKTEGKRRPGGITAELAKWQKEQQRKQNQANRSFRWGSMRAM